MLTLPTQMHLSGFAVPHGSGCFDASRRKYQHSGVRAGCVRLAEGTDKVAALEGQQARMSGT